MTAQTTMFRLSERPGLYVVAEGGVNHDGSVRDAHALVDLAADTGADAIKFQTFDPAAIASAQAAASSYQTAGTGVTNQQELLSRYVLPREAWAELRAHAADRGVDFLSTAFDLASLDLVCEVGVDVLKTGSGELTHRTLLEEVARRELPVICSTGMATESEVAAAVGWLAPAPGLVLLHCVSSYPAPAEECNLRAMVTMRERFALPVGWSDHTIGQVTSVAAVAMGASALEKHITLSNDRPGPDHRASADPDAFAAYVAAVREAHAALGSPEKAPTAAEAENAVLVRRSWHAARDLAAGERLEAADLVALRPQDGIPASADLVGQVLAAAVPRGTPLLERDLVAGP